MSEAAPNPIPAHVDPQLVVEFAYLAPPGFEPHGDIHAAWRLEEWLGRMPDVRLDPQLPAITEAGPVSKITRLNLLWDGAVARGARH